MNSRRSGNAATIPHNVIPRAGGESIYPSAQPAKWIPRLRGRSHFGVAKARTSRRMMVWGAARKVLTVLVLTLVVLGAQVSAARACVIPWQPMPEDMAKEAIDSAYFIGIAQVTELVKFNKSRVITYGPDGQPFPIEDFYYYATLNPVLPYKTEKSYTGEVLVAEVGAHLSPCNPSIKPRFKNQLLEVIVTKGTYPETGPRWPLPEPEPEAGLYIQTWILGEPLRKLRNDSWTRDGSLRKNCEDQDGLWNGDMEALHSVGFWCDLPAYDEWKVCTSHDDCEGFCEIDAKNIEEAKYEKQSLVDKIKSHFFKQKGRCSRFTNRYCGIIADATETTGETCIRYEEP